jgi:hypothetical protein
MTPELTALIFGALPALPPVLVLPGLIRMLRAREVGSA